MKNGKSINQKSYPLTRYGFICAVSRMESSSDLSLPLTAPVNIRSSQNKILWVILVFSSLGKLHLSILVIISIGKIILIKLKKTIGQGVGLDIMVLILYQIF